MQNADAAQAITFQQQLAEKCSYTRPHTEEWEGTRSYISEIAEGSDNTWYLNLKQKALLVSASWPTVEQ